MAEFKFEKLYRVTVREYEQGWGSKPCPEETKFFDNQDEAIAYAKEQTYYGKDTSWIADVTQLI